MKYFIYCFIILIVVSSCSKTNTVRTYYDSGELRDVSEYTNDSVYFLKQYYRNGHLRAVGNYTIKEDLAVGYQKYYYSDGTLQYQGNFIRGIPENIYNHEPFTTRSKGRIVGSNGELLIKIGEPWTFRIVMEDYFPAYYVVMDANCNSLDSGNTYNVLTQDFPYTILITQEDYDNCMAGKPNDCLKTNSCDTAYIFVNFPDTTGSIALPSIQPVLCFIVPIKK